MEKLALRPFLLFWLAWTTLRVMRDRPPLADLLARRPRYGALIAMARYIALLAVYFENDNILAGQSGQAALDLFGSPWITGFFLIVAGFAAGSCGEITDRS